MTREADGTYVVSTYDEIVALLHDPRVTSELRDSERAGATASQEDQPAGPPAPFIRRDPPEHDRLRRLATRPFGPPHTPRRIDRLRPWLAEITTALIDDLAGKDQGQVDIVDQLAYPLPVTVICELLGVPREDEPRFHRWSQAIISAVDPTTGTDEQRQCRRSEALAELGSYLNGLAEAHLRQPGDDLLSGMLTDTDASGGPMARDDLLATASLLLALAAGNRDPDRFDHPTASTPTVPTTSTSASAAASTTAMAPH